MIILSHRRGCECFFFGPPALEQSVSYCLRVQSGFFRPLNNGFHLAAKLNKVILSCVAALLFVRRPSHVAGLVVAVIVDAIKRMMRRWPGADVSVKRQKRMLPLFADSYSTTAIVPPLFIVWVPAAIQHKSPSVVFLGACHTVVLSCHKSMVGWNRMWNYLGGLFHNRTMTEFSGSRLFAGAAFAFPACQMSVFNARGI